MALVRGLNLNRTSYLQVLNQLSKKNLPAISRSPSIEFHTSTTKRGSISTAGAVVSAIYASSHAFDAAVQYSRYQDRESYGYTEETGKAWLGVTFASMFLIWGCVHSEHKKTIISRNQHKALEELEFKSNEQEAIINLLTLHKKYVVSDECKDVGAAHMWMVEQFKEIKKELTSPGYITSNTRRAIAAELRIFFPDKEQLEVEDSYLFLMSNLCENVIDRSQRFCVYGRLITQKK